MSRIAPLEPPYTAEAGAQLASMMPADVPPIGLFRVFARHLPMTSAMHGWGRYELGRQLTLSVGASPASLISRGADWRIWHLAQPSLDPRIVSLAVVWVLRMPSARYPQRHRRALAGRAERHPSTARAPGQRWRPLPSPTHHPAG